MVFKEENNCCFFLFQEKIHQANAAAARAKKLQKPRVSRQPVCLRGKRLLCLSNRKSFLSHISCVGDIFWHSCFSLAYLRRFFKTRKGKKEGSNCNLSFLSLSSFNRRTKTFHILLSHSLHLCNQSKIHQGNLFRYPVHYMRTSCQ